MAGGCGGEERLGRHDSGGGKIWREQAATAARFGGGGGENGRKGRGGLRVGGGDEIRCS